MRRHTLQQDLSRMMRRTNLRTDRVHSRIKDFVETSDDLTDQICTTVKKVLTTTDEAADLIHEAIQRVTRGDNSLRTRIEGLLDTEELSEEELGHEIRRFLDAAAYRATAKRSRQGRMKGLAEEMERAAESAADDVIPKLQDLVESTEVSVDELKHKLSDLIDSLTAKAASFGESKPHARFEEAPRAQEYNQNERMAEALDEHFEADGKLLQKYRHMKRFDAPVNGALLLALVSTLEKNRGELKHEEQGAAPSTEFESKPSKEYVS